MSMLGTLLMQRCYCGSPQWDEGIAGRGNLKLPGVHPPGRPVGFGVKRVFGNDDL
jgi:hypothetical protein